MVRLCMVIHGMVIHVHVHVYTCTCCMAIYGIPIYSMPIYGMALYSMAIYGESISDLTLRNSGVLAMLAWQPMMLLPMASR